MAYDFTALRVDLQDGIATVTIDHPPINLLDRTLFPEMAQLTVDGDVRAVVLRSANPEFFIAHFDVELILRLPTDLPAPTALHPFDQMCERFRTMPKPTIAVIEGRVGGGGSELALSCDMRFAALGKAVFNQPEVALGIIPGGSGTVRLSRLIGRSRAMEVVLGCDDVDAALAERWGWVNRALAADELWPFVERLVSRIGSFPRLAVREAKQAVLRADKEIEDDLLAEAASFNRTLADPAAHAAMRRFLDLGGQTVAGELRLAGLCAEVASPPVRPAG